MCRIFTSEILNFEAQIINPSNYEIKILFSSGRTETKTGNRNENNLNQGKFSLLLTIYNMRKIYKYIAFFV